MILPACRQSHSAVLSSIKLAYSPSRPDSRLKLTASAFNQLGQYTCSPGHRGYCCAELAVSSLAMGMTTASTHFTIPRRVEGWVDLAGRLRHQDGLPARGQSPIAVLNRARRRVTSFHPKRVINYATPPMGCISTLPRQTQFCLASRSSASAARLRRPAASMLQGQ